MDSQSRLSPEPWSRLSEAEIWTRLRGFYQGASRQAFQPGGIPFQITSNPTISHAYASMAASWIGDWHQSSQHQPRGIDPQQPIYILELGPGTGQFTFLFTQDLRRILECKRIGHLRSRHICADLGPLLLNDIAEHEKMGPLAADGLLDFAIFDATNPQAPFLLRAQQTLTSEDVVNPLIVIANYFLDSLPQDCFTMRRGLLYESMVQMSGEPGQAARMHYEQRPAVTPYYHDTELDSILDACRRRDEGVILFPIAGLKLLQWLWHFAGGRLLLLVADKGHYSAPELAYPAIEYHADNCISMMVYFRAIEEFWVKRGGQYHSAYREGTFLTFAAAEAGLECGESIGFAQSFNDHVVDHTSEDWDILSWRAVRDAHLYSAAEILACMRLSRWDPAVFRDFFPALFRRLAGISESEKAQVKEAIQRSLDRYYHLGEIPDLVFKGASVLYELGTYAEALALFEKSRKLNGPLPATNFQIGRCLYRLGKKTEALEEIHAALDAEPNFEDYLVGMGIISERRAVELAARIEWEISLLV